MSLALFKLIVINVGVSRIAYFLYGGHQGIGRRATRDVRRSEAHRVCQCSQTLTGND
jgi:hypothetical protein